MTNVLAIRPEPYERDFGLFYDLNAMSHNAKVVASIANACGFRPRMVLKGGYAHPNILEQLSSVDQFPISIGNSVGHPSIQSSVRDLATLYPGQASSNQAWRTIKRVTEATIEGVAIAISEVGRPDILIAVRTSEDREGIDIRDVPDFMNAVANQFGDRAPIAGFQLNYGCVFEAPPPRSETRELFNILACKAIMEKLPDRPVLSLGGSVLLPILHKLDLPNCYHWELRLGEAVVAGTIPGETFSLGLRRTASLNARVLQSRLSDDRQDESLLIEVGSQILSTNRQADRTTGLLFRSMGSEVSTVCRAANSVRKMSNCVMLTLDYCEIERALHRLRTYTAPEMIHWSCAD